MSASIKYHYPAGELRYLCGRRPTFSRGGIVTRDPALVECKRCKAKLDARAARQAARGEPEAAHALDGAAHG